MAAANIVTDVTNVTALQRPFRNVKPPLRFQELCNNTESEEEASVQHQKTLQKKTGNATNMEKMMVMLAVILVAIVAIDGSIKNARRSQTNINILSVIYVNLGKVV